MTQATRRLRSLFAGLLLLAASTALAGAPRIREVPPAEAPYGAYLRFAPATNAPRLDWLLVAPRDLIEAFEPLVEHRRDLGLAAAVVASEDVAGDILLGGGDLPERLRRLVQGLHASYGLRFLVLGADTNRLPARMLPFPIQGDNVHYGEPYASDAYFGCLDGEWNADADARFGEAEPQDDDHADVRHEVHVGRIPVESVREAETFVKKLLLYERPIHLDYQDRVAYLGGKVFVEDDAHDFYADLHERFFEPAGFERLDFTRPSDDIAVGDVLRALTAGVGVVCHYHHSFTYNLSLPRGAIDTGNFAEIKNAERPFVMFSNGCYANQFTKEGISEKLLLSPAGGAVAFLGSTNTCFSFSLALERAFWEIVFHRPGTSIGEALSLVRADAPSGFGSMGFLRLSFNLIGDPAMQVWPSRPVRAPFDVVGTKDGTLRVVLSGKARDGVRVACAQPGRWGAWRDVVELAAGEREVVLPPCVGNGEALRVTVFGREVVPSTRTVPDPCSVRIVGVTAGPAELRIDLQGADDVVLPIPDDLQPGPWSIAREVAGTPLRLVVPVLDGSDVGFVRGDEELRFPGFTRLAPQRANGLPLIAGGDARIVRAERDDAPGEELAVDVEATHDTLRLGWRGAPGARWLVELRHDDARRLLTPVPLVNPVLELSGLQPLTRVDLILSRLGASGETTLTASTTFAYQAGFPQRVGANVTSVQLLDVDGKRGKEVVFGDDKLGLWALRVDGSEVRHAGDAWTFGLFAAVEGGVFEPVVADLVGSKRPEILATSKLNDRKLYAFDASGKPVKGFPVSFGSRLMTPPLVGDFDGKRGNEVIVVSGFGKTIELVHADGRKEPLAEIGQYNYAYPIAVNLDRDRALELVVLVGAGVVPALDQEGQPLRGFPVDLGSPGRATPMVANLDDDRSLEIVAVGRGTTRLAVIDAGTGEIQADLAIPDAGAPANDSFFYPGLARLEKRGPLSILVGTPSKKLFAFDLKGGTSLQVRAGYPVDLPAEARGVAAVDVDDDGRDEIFLALHDGEVWGLSPDGEMLSGFPLRTRADTYGVPLLEDLDGDRDLELLLGAADGTLRVWDLPYRVPRKGATWPGLQGGSGLPGVPATDR